MKSLAGGIGAALLALIVIVIYLATRGGSDTITPTAGNDPVIITPGQTVTGPNFAGMALKGDTVVYVLDRGASSGQAMGEIKEAAYRSIASLGEGKKFRIVFWDTGKVEAFPFAEPTFATAKNIDAAREALADVYAFGASDAKASIESAIKNNPKDLILVTAKGWDLDEEFVKMVFAAVGSSGARVNTLSIGEPSAALQKIAERTGGQSMALSAGALRVAGK